MSQGPWLVLYELINFNNLKLYFVGKGARGVKKSQRWGQEEAAKEDVGRTQS